MNKTLIEWVKNPDGTQGYTWNPITGCLNHTPDGLCLDGLFPCYAWRLANGRLRERYLANENIATVYAEGGEPYHKANKMIARIDPLYPRFWENRFQDFSSPDSYDYQKILKPKGIFVCDMGKLFGDWVPSEWQKLIFNYIKDYPEHRFYFLTKQPQNLIKWSPFPDNCWVGVTVTSTEMFAQSLIRMQGIEARIKYISFEPLLEWNWNNTYQEPLELVLKAEGIDWLIIGAQTKPSVYPKLEWVEEIVQAADKARIPVFLKDNLAPLLLNLSIHDANAGLVDSLLDNVGRLRQELPG